MQTVLKHFLQDLSDILSSVPDASSKEIQNMIPEKTPF